MFFEQTKKIFIDSRFLLRIAVYWGCFFAWEMFLRAFSFESFFTWSLLRILLISLPMGISVAALFTLLPLKIRRWFVWILMPVIWIVYGSQIVYSNVFASFWSLNILGHAGDVLGDFVVDVFINILATLPWTLLAALPLVGIFFFERDNRIAGKSVDVQLKAGKLCMACLISIAFAMNIAVLGAFVPAAHNPASTMGVFLGNNHHNDSELFESIGFLGALGLQLTELVVPRGADSGLIDVPQWPEVENPNLPPPPTRPSDDPPSDNDYGECLSANDNECEDINEDTPPPPPPRPLYYNALNIDFAALASGTQNQRLSELHSFFGNRNPSRQNDFTGMFEGYNVIFIVAEGFADFAVRPDLTPTLYHMTHNGFHVPNFFTPPWNTSDGEFASVTSLIPRQGHNWFARTGRERTWLPFTLGMQFSAMDSQPWAFHNHTYTFYSRHISHPNLGYNWLGVGNGLNLGENLWPNSDLRMMEATVDSWINQEHFHVHYMTVSGHGVYDFVGNSMAWRHREAVSHLPYSIRARAYLATQLELEFAVTYLMERLEEAGIAERTVIAILPDHPPQSQFLTNAELAELRGRPVENQQFDRHLTGMVLYARGMQPVRVERPVSNVDLLPTLLNLLNLPFDSRMMMGTDFLSDSPSIVIFNDGSFITDNGRFFANTGHFAPNHGVTVPSNYAEIIRQQIIAMRAASAAIIDLDYFRSIERYIRNPVKIPMSID